MNNNFCANCGNGLNPGANVCPNCGRRVQAPVVYNTYNNINYDSGYRMCDKWVAFILCWFLGVIGIHKFYEGKIGMGILYIFTLGLFGIGVIVDLIVILCKPNKYYAK